MERVNDLKSPPIVGETYLVECVKHYTYYFDPSSGYESHSSWEYVPVFGKFHEDENIGGTSEKHIHPDLRFISTENLYKYYLPNPVSVYVLRKTDCEEVNEKEFVCFTSDFPMKSGFVGKPLKRRLFIKSLRDKKFKLNMNCKVCPHKGTNLDSIKVNEHGRIMCPMHGLEFGKTTGKIFYKEYGPKGSFQG